MKSAARLRDDEPRAAQQDCAGTQAAHVTIQCVAAADIAPAINNPAKNRSLRKEQYGRQIFDILLICEIFT
jgi:hypothetical protein